MLNISIGHWFALSESQSKIKLLLRFFCEIFNSKNYCYKMKHDNMLHPNGYFDMGVWLLFAQIIWIEMILKIRWIRAFSLSNTPSDKIKFKVPMNIFILNNIRRWWHKNLLPVDIKIYDIGLRRSKWWIYIVKLAY